MTPIAVYVHIPFCPSKCGYCDFNSYAMNGEIMERTTHATIQEIWRSPTLGRPAQTIFFGGGTPTFLPPKQLTSILEAVIEAHPPIDECEITSEANPGTVDATRFRAMKMAGFNRISLGAQSFLNSDLIRLGRVHEDHEIDRAVAAAREAGFENLNLDLMFALPDQSERGWEENLRHAIDLAPEHLSLYCLTIEPNTEFYKKNLRGQLPLPDDDRQVEMYEKAVQATREAGYLQYEISNFAKVGRECRHNLLYWRGAEYAGYGPGAVGCVEADGVRKRYTNLKHPERYAAAVEGGARLAFEEDVLDLEKTRMERIMLGLRLNEGVSIADLSLSPKSLEELTRRGWLAIDGSRMKLTREGRHFCSEVALELI